MSWRQPMAEEKPNPIAELLRPKTLNEMVHEHFQELIDMGEDISDYPYDLN
jgi:hypothetical protein